MIEGGLVWMFVMGIEVVRCIAVFMEVVSLELRAALTFLSWLTAPLLLARVGFAFVYEETVPL